MNIMMNLASAGCSGGYVYVQTLITTTADTGRRIIIPKNQRFWNRSGRSIIATMGLPDTGI